jgi:hypothetical protein
MKADAIAGNRDGRPRCDFLRLERCFRYGLTRYGSGLISYRHHLEEPRDALPAHAR